MAGHQYIAPRLDSGPSTSGDESKSQWNKRRKSSPVPAACQNCRRRKAKCDALRPACHSCLFASLPCAYDLPEGLTPREAAKRNLRHLATANENLRTVIEYMRACSEDECVAIVRRIRRADSVDDAVQALVDASLLLRGATAAWGSEAGSPAQSVKSGGTPNGPGEPPPSPEMQR